MEREIFVSYARNFEDVMLWRALKDVSNGFYIDVGAVDPDVDSVSKAFYRAGWRGVHVPAQGSDADKLRSCRPGDAVPTGLAGAPGQEAGNGPSLGELLSSVPEPVQWLRIGMQGAELAAIKSWGDCPARPWILVRRGYRHMYFDGINRFYLHADHPELAIHFESGPNALDHFSLSGTATNQMASLIHENRKAQMEGLQARALTAEAEIKRSAAQRDQLARQLADISSSTSWRLTYPFRLAMKALRNPLQAVRKGLSGASSAASGWRIAPRKGLSVASAVARRLARHQGMKQFVRRLVDVYPPLGRKVRQLLRHVPAGVAPEMPSRGKRSLLARSPASSGAWMIDLSASPEDQLESMERQLLDAAATARKKKA